MKEGVIPVLLAVPLLLSQEIQVRRWDCPALELTAELLEENLHDKSGCLLFLDSISPCQFGYSFDLP